MRTRRVRRALNKIEHLLETDGIKEDSDLFKSFTDFRNKFIGYYKTQMIPRDVKKKRPIMRFKAASLKRR